MNPIVYEITEEEKKEIFDINNEKNAYIELLSKLPKGSPLYPEVFGDFKKTNMQYSEWFVNFEKKYKTQMISGATWNVDFLKNTVTLMTTERQ